MGSGRPSNSTSMSVRLDALCPAGSLDRGAEDATQSRVILAFLRPVNLSAPSIDGDADAPPRLVAAVDVASARLHERLNRRPVEVRAHDAHPFAVRPVQLAAELVELKLFGSERAPLGNDRLAIPPVEVGALDGAVVQVGDAHVGPVDVPTCDIDRDAIRHPTLVDDDLAVGAIRVHREHAVAAEVENVQAVERGSVAGGACRF